MNPANIYLMSLSAGPSRNSTRRLLLGVVRYFSPDGTIEGFQWAELKYPDLVQYRSHLQENYAPNSANRALAIIRQVLTAARRLGQISAETGELLRAALAGIRGEREPAGRMLEVEEIDALFVATDCASSRWHQIRNAAMLAVLFGGGLRRNEICKAQAQNLRKEPDGQYMLVIMGKGNKERTIPLPIQTSAVLEAWLHERGTAPGFLFPHRGNPSQGCNPEVINKWINKLAHRAGIAKMSPHDGRRTYISNLLDHGAEIVIVARLAGHKQLDTTRRYDRRDVRSMKRAVNLLSYRLSR